MIRREIASAAAEQFVLQTIGDDPWMTRCLRALRECRLADCWIGAGFVRNKIWDALSGRTTTSCDDLDAIHFDANDPDEPIDRRHENHLTQLCPGERWSVKNQARMHVRNGDAPYRSSVHAIEHWPERCTAIAVRLDDRDLLVLCAPFGLSDLMEKRVRPTPWFQHCKMHVFHARQQAKKWHERWPDLSYV